MMFTIATWEGNPVFKYLFEHSDKYQSSGTMIQCRALQSNPEYDSYEVSNIANREDRRRETLDDHSYDRMNPH